MTQNVNYSTLLELIPSYSERRDTAFLDKIPTFIMLAENRLATDMKQQGFQTVVNGNLPMDTSMAKPQWWRETISFKYTLDGVVQPLTLRSLEYCQNYWPATAQKAPPRFYADYNINNFYLAGTPDFQYEFELVYFARLEPLDVTHQDNWMTLNAPQALLFACLLESALWRKNDADVAKWTGQYQGAAGGKVTEDKERVVDRNTVVR